MVLIKEERVGLARPELTEEERKGGTEKVGGTRKKSMKE